MFNNQGPQGPQNNNPLFGIVQNLVQKNPNAANNPMTQQFLNVLASGDNTKGEEMARNICKSMGMSEQEAIMRAKQFFNLPR